MHTSGVLKPVGRRMLGVLDSYDYWRCSDCGTFYPKIDGTVKCNGQPIGACPWCRQNSAPWTNGRGL